MSINSPDGAGTPGFYFRRCSPLSAASATLRQGSRNRADRCDSMVTDANPPARSSAPANRARSLHSAGRRRRSDRRCGPPAIRCAAKIVEPSHVPVELPAVRPMLLAVVLDDHPPLPVDQVATADEPAARHRGWSTFTSGSGSPASAIASRSNVSGLDSAPGRISRSALAAAICLPRPRQSSTRSPSWRSGTHGRSSHQSWKTGSSTRASPTATRSGSDSCDGKLAEERSPDRPPVVLAGRSRPRCGSVDPVTDDRRTDAAAVRRADADVNRSSPRAPVAAAATAAPRSGG